MACKLCYSPSFRKDFRAPSCSSLSFLNFSEMIHEAINDLHLRSCRSFKFPGIGQYTGGSGPLRLNSTPHLRFMDRRIDASFSEGGGVLGRIYFLSALLQSSQSRGLWNMHHIELVAEKRTPGGVQRVKEYLVHG